MCKHNSTRCYTESECHKVMGSARLGIMATQYVHTHYRYNRCQASCTVGSAIGNFVWQNTRNVLLISAVNYE